MIKLFTALLTIITGVIIGFAINVVKVNVCHHTGSPSNPYVLVVVSVQSVEDAINLGGHGNHEDDAWHAYEFEGVTYPARNEDVFGSLIDDSCNLIVPTATPTNTEVPSATPTSTNTNTPTFTPTSTNTPTSTQTEVPTSTFTPTPTSTGTQPTPSITPTSSPTPTTDPRTPTGTPTETQMPTKTPTPFITLTPDPTETPKPPQPADGKEDAGGYPGAEMGNLVMGGDIYPLYLGVNAKDGSLLLPSYNKGAALYLKTIWVHRMWSTGWLDLEVGDTIYFENIVGMGRTYTIVEKTRIDYGVYPKTETFGNVFQYIATCYSNDQGEWVGVELFKLKPDD